jgi:hypothetical protein
MEKSLNRVAEPALVVLSSFFSSLPPSISSDPSLRAKLAPAVLTPTKATSAPTRGAAIQLFETLFASSTEVSPEDAAALIPVAEQVYLPLRTGKTTSPDHRTTLYTLLSLLPSSSPQLSAEITSTALTALSKESNEATVLALSRAVATHLPSVLRANTPVSAPQIAALVKAMGDTKPPIRRAAHGTVGAVFWALKDEEATEAEKKLGEGLAPGFEGAVKTMTASALNNPSGPLEGYVAVAVLKSRAKKWEVKKIGALFLLPSLPTSALTDAPSPQTLS